MKRSCDPDGTSVCYEYDPKGRLTYERTFDAAQNMLKEERFHYKGPPLDYKKDAMGVRTHFYYDGAGRKIKEVKGDFKVITYRYDAFDRIIEKREDDRIELTHYDAVGQTIGKTWYDKGIIVRKEGYSYDLQGNLLEKKVWFDEHQQAIDLTLYNSDGTLRCRVDPMQRRTHYSYDYGIPYPGGGFVKKVTTTDPLGRETIDLFDPYGRVVERKILENNQTVSSFRWVYDQEGRCIKELASVMAEGKAIRDFWVERKHNSSGLLIEETEMPAKRRIAYHYDSMKRMIEKKKPNGVSLITTYDALGRKKTFSSTDGSVSYEYTYDLHDNIIEIKDLVNHCVQERKFDKFDRLEREEFSSGITIHYNYDKLDRLLKMTLPDGTFVLYHHTPWLSRMERYQTPDAPRYAIEIPEYDLKGNLLKMNSAVGLTTWAYDASGRCVEIRAPAWFSRLEKFDEAGKVTQLEQNDPSGMLQRMLAYDGFDHLISEQGYEEHSYAYDSLGNCLQNDQKKQQINDSNQIVCSHGESYSYGRNGNLKEERACGIRYHYDALNRLVLCEKEGKRTSFTYDAFGRCLSISSETGTRHLFYQGYQEIGSVAAGKVDEFRLVHPDDRYDLTFAVEASDRLLLTTQDERRNLCCLQSEEGRVIQWARYSAFGIRSVYGEKESLIIPWSFANRRQVAHLTLFTHRFYHSHLMRWLTTDPLGYSEGLNLYCYVRNNPFDYRDPDGRFVVAIPIFSVAFGAATSVAFFPAFATAVVAAAATYGVYKAGEYVGGMINDYRMHKDDVEESENEKSKDEKRPPYCGQKLGDDATKCPGEGFEWKGKGSPTTGRGSWVKNHCDPSEETLHPDLQHPPPKPAHWDYVGPDFPDGVELYLDGSWRLK